MLAATFAGWLAGSFDFLRRPTGWQMGFSILPQRSSDPYWWTIGLSFANTVLLSFAAIAIATTVGTLVAIVIVSGNKLWSRIAAGYVQLFRNMPLLLQAVFWFAVIANGPAPRQAYGFAGFQASNRGLELPFPTLYGFVVLALFILAFVLARAATRQKLNSPALRRLLPIGIAAGAVCPIIVFASGPLISVPELSGFGFTGGLHVPTELLAILIALSMFSSAYIAEIVRGGFQTVPVGMIEAARALALPRWVIETKVRIPLALRAIVLPLGSQYTVLIKTTSIGLAVGFTDLFAVTLISINQSGQTIPLLCLMTVGFILINQLVVSLTSKLNSAIEIPGHDKS